MGTNGHSVVSIRRETCLCRTRDAISPTRRRTTQSATIRRSVSRTDVFVAFPLHVDRPTPETNPKRSARSDRVGRGERFRDKVRPVDTNPSRTFVPGTDSSRNIITVRDDDGNNNNKRGGLCVRRDGTRAGSSRTSNKNDEIIAPKKLYRRNDISDFANVISRPDGRPRIFTNFRLPVLFVIEKT